MCLYCSCPGLNNSLFSDQPSPRYPDPDLNYSLALISQRASTFPGAKAAIKAVQAAEEGIFWFKLRITTSGLSSPWKPSHSKQANTSLSSCASPCRLLIEVLPTAHQRLRFTRSHRHPPPTPTHAPRDPRQQAPKNRAIHPRTSS